MTEGKKAIKTIMMVIGLTIGSKVFGFLREVLISSRFGTSMESDAYFMALKVTAIVFMGIGSAITTTMIPIIVQYITKGEKKKAFAFANKIFTIMLLISLLVIPLGIILAPIFTKYIAFGFYDEKMELTVELIRLMFPILICTFLTYIFVSLLQSLDKFSITSILSMPYNLVLLVYLIFFVRSYGIRGLAVATAIGWIFQFLIQVPFLYKSKYRLKMNFDFKDRDIRTFFRLILPILISTIVYNINIIVDSSLASTLSEGKLSALNYGFVIYTTIASTTIYGISTVLFPSFAKNTSSDNLSVFKDQVTSTLKVLSFILVPLTVGLITLRTPIIKLAFERGAFDGQAVAMTKIALTYYAIGMIGFGIQEVLNKSFFALKDTKTPTKFGILSVVINIVLNLILIRVMDLGGLALATSIATISNGLLLFIALSRKIGNVDIISILKNLFKIVISAAAMALAAYGSYQMILQWILSSSFFSGLVVLAVPVIVGIAVYSVATIVLKVEEAQYIIRNFSLKRIRK